MAKIGCSEMILVSTRIAFMSDRMCRARTYDPCRIPHTGQDELLITIGLRPMHRRDFIIEHVFQQWPLLCQRLPNETFQYMNYMLRSIDFLQRLEGVVPALSTLPWMRSPRGVLRATFELLHPKVIPAGMEREVSAVFAVLNVGAAELEGAERLGLDARRGVSFAAADLQNANEAKLMWRLLTDPMNGVILYEAETDQPDGYLHRRNPPILDRLRAELWLPVLADRVSGAPWRNDDRVEIAPCMQVRPRSELFLVSASSYVLDIDEAFEARIPQRLKEMLGWDTPPAIDVLLAQLKAIADAGVVHAEDGYRDGVKALYAALELALAAHVDEHRLEAGEALCNDVRDTACILIGNYLVRPDCVAHSLMQAGAPATHNDVDAARMLCRCCREVKLMPFPAVQCVNRRCPSLRDGSRANLPAIVQLVGTSRVIETYQLNNRLRRLPSAFANAFPTLCRCLRIRDHFDLEQYEWGYLHCRVQLYARRFIKRRTCAATVIEAVMRGWRARCKAARMSRELAGVALDCVHKTVQRTGRESLPLLLCSVAVRLPAVRDRRGAPDASAITAFGSLVSLLRQSAQQRTMSVFSVSSSPLQIGGQRASRVDSSATWSPPGLTSELWLWRPPLQHADFIADSRSGLEAMRAGLHKQQISISKADDLESALTLRNEARSSLVEALRSAEIKLVQKSGFVSLKEFNTVAAALQEHCERIQRAISNAVASTCEMAQLGSKAELPRNEQGEVFTSAHTALERYDQYVRPAELTRTDEAAARADLMQCNPLKLVEMPMDAADRYGEVLIQLSEAIRNESKYWKRYHPVEHFPSTLLISAARAELQRCSELYAGLCAVLDEARQLREERGHQEDALKTPRPHPLFEQLEELKRQMLSSRDALEDATTALKRAR